MIKITLPDNSIREYSQPVTPMEVAQSISEGLARNVLSAKVNDQQVETSTPITSDSQLMLFTWKDAMGKKAFWHSSAHLLAQAIMEFYPEAKLTLGPPIENGFYYDIDFGDNPISEKDFDKIEKRMLENARKKLEFKKYSVAKDEALKTYAGNEFKTELISNLKDGAITFVTHGNFTDLCRGGHIPNTGMIKAVKLLNIAGAYWRGDEKNKQLTRIYGISFPKQKDLKEYLHLLEEAKKRDHRKLGKALGLFTFSQKVGAGLPLWLPKGTALRKRLEDFLSNAQLSAGYEFVATPHIGNKQLYITSGHYSKYGEDSFQPIKTPNEGEEYLLKPMNCPHHCEIYNAGQWSYRDLPKRYAEFGTVYRYEQSGELHGLTRVRGFTQDDAHIFCTPEQLLTEFKKVIDLVLYIFESLGFDDFEAQISLRDPDNPDKYIGTKENWKKAEKAIVQAVSEKKISATVKYGEAAFYGPKLDFMVKDALKRKWQLGTIQVDYNLPERFNLSYKDSNNQDQRPVMIHRAPFGSLERFIAILLEHTEGVFPIWLSPEPYKILPISEKYQEYAEKILHLLAESNIRGGIDSRNETIGRKIRDCESAKIPYMIIVGERESQMNKVSIRKHKVGDLGSMNIKDFIEKLQKEVFIV